MVPEENRLVASFPLMPFSLFSLFRARKASVKLAPAAYHDNVLSAFLGCGKRTGSPGFRI